VEAGVGGLVEEQLGVSGRVTLVPMWSLARWPARAVGGRAPSVGRVRRAIVQLSGLSVFSRDIARSSRYGSAVEAF
jgi:hypothetical protein